MFAAVCLVTAAVTAPAWALEKSTGPALGDPNTIGPDGARIEPVKDANTFALDGQYGSDPNNTNPRQRIGQWELGEPLRTHTMLRGRTTVRGIGDPNDRHATGVASILIGSPMGGLRGVAHEAQVFSTGHSTYHADVDWLIGRGVKVINQSAIWRPDATTHADGNSYFTLVADSRVFQNEQLVWVVGAGNDGRHWPTITIPADGYNVIAVGATGADANGAASTDYTRVANYSSGGPTHDGRHKPDIVAPGSRINMASNGHDANTQEEDGTSCAAPHVAGMAALLAERPRPFNHLAVKSTLLNSASKHVRDPARGDRTWPELVAAAGGNLALDDAMGVGQLNGLAAVRQYQDTNRTDVGVRTGAVTGGNQKDYDLFQNELGMHGRGVLQKGSLVTATLVWDRPVTLRAGGDPNNPADYLNKDLPNLNLALVDSGGAVVHVSDSGGGGATGGDSVEHIYFNIPDTPAPQGYKLRVINSSPNDVPYALTWTAGSSDGVSFSVDGGMFNQGRAVKNPADGQVAPFLGNHFPNDVNALGPAGPGNFPTEGEIFVSSCDGTNMQRLSGALGTLSRVGPHNGPPAALAIFGGRGVLGIEPNDNVAALSWGTDGTAGWKSVVVFSVDPAAVGTPGTWVHKHAVEMESLGPAFTPYPDNPGGGNLDSNGHEAAGDVYKTQRLDEFGQYASDELRPAGPLNMLHIDEVDLGLQAPANNGGLVAPLYEDDLDALEMDSVLKVDTNGDGLHDRP
ncbi:MAG: S8 family serine peptidase, partial [Phycisphaerae bacterium]